MNWSGVAFLGTRYLARHRRTTLLLVIAFTLVWLLPTSIALVVGKVEEQLRSRAADTPLLLGHPGSPLELVFNGLYFTKPGLATLPLKEATAAAEDGLAQSIPIYARFSAGGHRIVGTNLDYFRFRGLEIAEGRSLVRLGECVVGAKVAEANRLSPGDFIVSSPETLFDLAGVYPLKMKVSGILEPTGSPDDRAIFVDLKTAWIIEGLGHGHDEADELDDDQRLESSEEDEAVSLNASVMEYNEVTPETMDRFHFHGDLEDYPVTAAIVVPNDAKSRALVKGRYASDSSVQLVSPERAMDELFATVFSVQRFVIWLLGAIGAATIAIGALVFLLSHRLRQDEFRHLRQLGADLATIRALVAFEAAFVVLASLALSAVGLLAIEALAPMVIRALIA
ncbi:MAG: ABC transporter permease [Verrucomicrobiales bacterium]